MNTFVCVSEKSESLAALHGQNSIAADAEYMNKYENPYTKHIKHMNVDGKDKETSHTTDS